MFEMVHMCDWSNTRNLKIKTIKNQNAGQTTQTILDLLIIIIIIIGEKMSNYKIIMNFSRGLIVKKTHWINTNFNATKV